MGHYSFSVSNASKFPGILLFGVNLCKPDPRKFSRQVHNMRLVEMNIFELSRHDWLIRCHKYVRAENLSSIDKNIGGIGIIPQIWKYFQLII